MTAIEAKARKIHDRRGGCPVCILGSIPCTPSWDELFESSKAKHVLAARAELAEALVLELVDSFNSDQRGQPIYDKALAHLAEVKALKETE